jgi:flagellar assembly protein FliH
MAKESGGTVAKAATQTAWLVEEFAYPKGPDAIEPRWAFEEDDSAENYEPGDQYSPATPELTKQLQSESLLEAERCGFAEGREQGRDEGRTEEREHQRAVQAALVHAAETGSREERAHLIECLDTARQQYLHEIEPEVVRLALAVSARILRREAQMDPLLLSGAVRVALGQLASSTRVKLKVPEDDLELWREAIALVPNPGKRPEVAAGEGMRLGDCVIETELGSVDLGVRAQLSEIERGFFDRPGSRAANDARRNSEEETV